MVKLDGRKEKRRFYMVLAISHSSIFYFTGETEDLSVLFSRYARNPRLVRVFFTEFVVVEGGEDFGHAGGEQV